MSSFEDETCKCVHASVCRHRAAVLSAFNDILEKTFGPGPTTAQQDLSKLIKTHCRFRKDYLSFQPMACQ